MQISDVDSLTKESTGTPILKGLWYTKEQQCDSLASAHRPRDSPSSTPLTPRLPLSTCGSPNYSPAIRAPSPNPCPPSQLSIIPWRPPPPSF